MPWIKLFLFLISSLVCLFNPGWWVFEVYYRFRYICIDNLFHMRFEMTSLLTDIWFNWKCIRDFVCKLTVKLFDISVVRWFSTMYSLFCRLFSFGLYSIFHLYVNFDRECSIGASTRLPFRKWSLGLMANYLKQAEKSKDSFQEMGW